MVEAVEDEPVVVDERSEMKEVAVNEKEQEQEKPVPMR